MYIKLLSLVILLLGLVNALQVVALKVDLFRYFAILEELFGMASCALSAHWVVSDLCFTIAMSVKRRKP